MEFKRCSKGHFYDPSVTSTCPQCAAEERMGQNAAFQADLGMTAPVSNIDDYGATAPVSGGMEDYGATTPISGVDNFGATEPIYGGGGDIGETMPPMQDNGFGGNGVEDYEEATQPVSLGGIAGFTPVTGWLVCVDGPARGKDFRIRAGYNYIGRAEHMDICITGDNKIGRERHAMIAYDPEEKVFFFGPADGKSIVRLNGKMVMVPSEIQAYDVITIGATKLMFVPLCGERFSWDA